MKRLDNLLKLLYTLTSLFCSIVLALLLGSCSEPNPKKTTDNKSLSLSESVPYRDRMFVQEYHEAFPMDSNEKGAQEVKAILPLDDGTVWMATMDGVFRKSKDLRSWEPMLPEKDQGPAFDLEIDGQGRIWAALWNGVYRSNGRGNLELQQGTQPPIAVLANSEEGMYALGPKGIWLKVDEGWSRKEYRTGRSIRSALSDQKGGLWIGTDVGLFHCGPQGVTIHQGKGQLISAYLSSMAYATPDTLWVGGMGGVSIRANGKMIDEKRPKDGLPHSQVNVVRKSPNGTMWVGTDYGISRFAPGTPDYSVRLSQRWLMNNTVNDIAFDSKGNAWIATEGGVSVIHRLKMTLENKADFYYQRLLQRYVREPGAVGLRWMEIPGDTTTSRPSDTDNDGYYTAMYLAMESFRYAVTGDPLAKERAQKTFDFLHLLREVTQIPGFFARTVVPAEWEYMHDMNRTYTEREYAKEIVKNPRQKPVEKRWHVSNDGKWKWKGDTSSDEMCGHLFGYYCYYTLVADEDEKKQLVFHYRQIMDALIANNYNLIGVDGKHTKWGVWSPDQLNRDPEWRPEKGINSLELLAFLKFTYSITGDSKYQEHYTHLIEKEGYLDNIDLMLDPDPAWETYFDIYLALYVYTPLIMGEEDEEIKARYLNHLDGWYERYKPAGSPMLNFVYNWLKGGADGLEASVFFLKDAPLDPVDWIMDNGAREDLPVLREPILEVLQVPLRPPSEYRTMRWDRNPYHAVAGWPNQERDPVYWLLPYWMGRYLELIQPK